VPKLFETLAMARGDGVYARILNAIDWTGLIILDDPGLSIRM